MEMVVGWVEVMVANVEGISEGDSQTWKLEMYSTCNNQKGFHQRYGVQGFCGEGYCPGKPETQPQWSPKSCDET